MSRVRSLEGSYKSLQNIDSEEQRGASFSEIAEKIAQISFESKKDGIVGYLRMQSIDEVSKSFRVFKRSLQRQEEEGKRGKEQAHEIKNTRHFAEIEKGDRTTEEPYGEDKKVIFFRI